MDIQPPTMTDEVRRLVKENERLKQIVLNVDAQNLRLRIAIKQMIDTQLDGGVYYYDPDHLLETVLQPQEKTKP